MRRVFEVAGQLCWPCACESESHRDVLECPRCSGHPFLTSGTIGIQRCLSQWMFVDCLKHGIAPRPRRNQRKLEYIHFILPQLTGVKRDQAIATFELRLSDPCVGPIEYEKPDLDQVLW